jgi:hypothetical protein
MQEKPELYIIPGGLTPRFQVGAVQLVPATLRESPFPVPATVVEEDTWRVLSTPSILHSNNEHPVRLMTDLVHDQPASPGTVVMKGRRWLAIVYDLDQEPPCTEEWILQALENILKSAQTKQIRSLALPLLGSRHGGIPWQRSLELILDKLSGASSRGFPERVWLQITADQRIELQQLLAQRFPPKEMRHTTPD